MRTQLLTLQVSLQAPPNQLRSAVAGDDILRSDALRSHIETQLKAHGAPLRWAITHIDTNQKKAHIEAVVTTIKPEIRPEIRPEPPLSRATQADDPMTSLP